MYLFIACFPVIIRPAVYQCVKASQSRIKAAAGSARSPSWFTCGVCSPYRHRAGGLTELSGVPFTRSLMPFVRAPPSQPNPSCSCHHPVGGSASTYGSGETHTHPVHSGERCRPRRPCPSGSGDLGGSLPRREDGLHTCARFSAGRPWGSLQGQVVSTRSPLDGYRPLPWPMESIQKAEVMAAPLSC